MRGPHVLVANVHFAPLTYGGATVVAEEVARALKNQWDYRITAVSTCEMTDLVPYAMICTEQAGIRCYLINLPPHRSQVARYSNPQITERMMEILMVEEPDVVHAHCLQDLGTGPLEAAQDRGIPTILSTHDYWWLCERQFMVRVDEAACGQDPVQLEGCARCLTSRAAGRARRSHLDRVVAGVSQVTYPSRFAKDLAERSGFAKGKGRLWQNGIALPGRDFEHLRQSRRHGDGRFTFGYLGGPATLKGWPLIREAFAGIEREDFAVLLADGSRDGHWWRGVDLSDLPGDWRVQPRFEQAKMDHFYAGIDLLLFPSQWSETFGLVVREALARGIPVIQTDCGGAAAHGLDLGEDLLPVGGGADPLRRRLEYWLSRGPGTVTPFAARSFYDQAAELDAVILSLLSQGDTFRTTPLADA